MFVLDDDHYELDLRTVRDLAPEVLDDRGRLKILPAAYWATTTPQERLALGARHGLYSLPTVELVEHLRTVIDGRPAIEIGAGSGVLAEALAITATDSHQQDKEPYRSRYIADGQTPVRYGAEVVDCDAVRAVRRYRPAVVIACWVTHKYLRTRHHAGGNMAGVVEEDVIAGCEQYVFIGNERVHRRKPILALPHTTSYPDFLYSRALNGTREYIKTWRNPAR